jgi:16S rRNA (guanine966-N2)-methyltransferase
MHILAGRFRRRRLESPPGKISRPTLSRVRQALCNVLAPRLADARFLDLYAGAGSVGLEAYSQGCRRVVLVESDRQISPVLARNAALLDPAGAEVEVLATDAASAVRKLKARDERFDLIFLDPPYREEALAAWAVSPDLTDLLAADGWLICQHERRAPLPEEFAGCRRLKEKEYGRTVLTFYARPETRE